MNTLEKIRTAFRRAPVLGWSALGLLLLAGLLLLVAMAKSEPTVTGIVRLDGEPLSKGSIRFVPVEGTRGSDAGVALRKGKYRIEKGLTAGRYKVEIQAARVVLGKKVRDPLAQDLIDAEEAIVFEEFNPIREVGPGLNTYDFDLKVARKRR
jgi:hypothetical protein